MAIITSPSACIQADPEQISKVVLMPGDPLRAKTLAETYFTDTVCFNTVRNMLGFTGTYKGKRVSVMGSGMGVPSMTLYAHELYNFFGVETILRIGSAGGLAERTHVRDLVLAMSACTNSNFASQYDFPATLAPTADFGLLYKAYSLCAEKNIPVDVGPVLTTDPFYNANPHANERFRDMDMRCVEMETAGLYLEAMASKKRALSILTISDHIFSGVELTAQERQDSFTDMMEIALDTALYALGD